MKQNNKITQCWCNSYLKNNENDINDDEAHKHLVQQDFSLWKQLKTLEQILKF
jgi:hypothetical protein